MSGAQAAAGGELARPCVGCPYAEEHAGRVVTAFDGRVSLRLGELRIDDRVVRVSRSEGAILAALMRRSGTVSYDMLTLATEPYHRDNRMGDSGVLKVQISRLRSKLAAAGVGLEIVTVWGFGFSLRLNPSARAPGHAGAGEVVS